MSNGKPTRSFFLVATLVVLGLVALGFWRFGSDGSGSSGGDISLDELGGAEAPDEQGITTVKEYTYVPAARLPDAARAGGLSSRPRRAEKMRR